MFLLELVGRWTGNKWLWRTPSEPPKVSPASAAIVPVARGKFVRVDYSWSIDGTPQEGTLLAGFDAHQGIVSGAWVDSWHMGDRLLACAGTLSSPSVFSMTGSCADAPGPSVWSITIERGDGRSFTVRVYSVSPEGHKDMTMEAIFKRNE